MLVLQLKPDHLNRSLIGFFLATDHEEILFMESNTSDDLDCFRIYIIDHISRHKYAVYGTLYITTANILKKSSLTLEESSSLLLKKFDRYISEPDHRKVKSLAYEILLYAGQYAVKTSAYEFFNRPNSNKKHNKHFLINISRTDKIFPAKFSHFSFTREGSFMEYDQLLFISNKVYMCNRLSKDFLFDCQLKEWSDPDSTISYSYPRSPKLMPDFNVDLADMPSSNEKPVDDFSKIEFKEGISLYDTSHYLREIIPHNFELYLVGALLMILGVIFTLRGQSEALFIVLLGIVVMPTVHNKILNLFQAKYR